MAQSLPLAYDSSTANNTLGFRIVAAVSQQEEEASEESMECCANSSTISNSFVFWTFLRGMFFGCPRTMIETLFRYLGYDAATMLGVSSLAETSLAILASIALLDLAGYLAVITAVSLLSQLIPWSSLESYFSRVLGFSSTPSSTLSLPEDKKQEGVMSSF